jgi:transcriptional regulator with XRE-family HTH domain
MTDLDNWHVRLTCARSAKKFTKSALAPLVGVSPPAITGWENGNTKKLDGDYLMKVCRVLEITPEWLMHGDGAANAGMPSAVISNDEISTVDHQCGSELVYVTPEEIRLLTQFREIDERGRRQVSSVLQFNHEWITKLR